MWNLNLLSGKYQKLLSVYQSKGTTITVNHFQAYHYFYALSFIRVTTFVQKILDLGHRYFIK